MSRFVPLITLYLTLLVALVLELMPLPALANDWRAPWVLLVLCYWVLALPHRINIGHGWVLGLLMDALLGAPLGLHALALTLVAYVLAANFQRLRTMGLVQQALVIGVLAVAWESVQMAGEWFLNGEPWQLRHIQPALTATLLWPWLFVLLRRVRRRFVVR